MASTFDVIPAIDLRGGRVVRLEQGDFGRETRYADDPVDVARRFVADGARFLHVVDLDGARSGEPRQLAVVRDIAAVLDQSVTLEAAGGIRTMRDADAVFDAGARRVVFGTAALVNRDLVGGIVRTRGAEAVAIAVDVRSGRAIGDAWEGETGPPATDVIERLADLGAAWFEVTAIDRDGLLGGPDLALLGELLRLGRGRLIASAGIRDVADLRAVRDLGCAGAIVGRAIYEGTLDLAEAVSALGPG